MYATLLVYYYTYAAYRYTRIYISQSSISSSTLNYIGIFVRYFRITATTAGKFRGHEITEALGTLTEVKDVFFGYLPVSAQRDR